MTSTGGHVAENVIFGFEQVKQMAEQPDWSWNEDNNVPGPVFQYTQKEFDTGIFNGKVEYYEPKES